RTSKRDTCACTSVCTLFSAGKSRRNSRRKRTANEPSRRSFPSLADVCSCVVASIELTARRRACLLRTRSFHTPRRAASMPKLYDALAEAFLAEGVDTQFILMGDGNMHWSTAFAKLPGVRTVHVRHEHATVAAATAYNVATGKIAVASVTCGPGLTQVMTAL